MLVGGTPLHEFNLGIDISMIEDVEIIYRQCGEDKLIKRLSDCEAEGSTIKLKLTQEETFLFTPGGMIEMQIRVKTIGNEVVPSEIFYDEATRCLSEESL